MTVESKINQFCEETAMEEFPKDYKPKKKFCMQICLKIFNDASDDSGKKQTLRRKDENRLELREAWKTGQLYKNWEVPLKKHSMAVLDVNIEHFSTLDDFWSEVWKITATQQAQFHKCFNKDRMSYQKTMTDEWIPRDFKNQTPVEFSEFLQSECRNFSYAFNDHAYPPFSEEYTSCYRSIKKLMPETFEKQRFLPTR